MHSIQANANTTGQWLPQLLQTINDNPELATLIQGIASGIFGQQQESTGMLSNEPIEAEFEDDVESASEDSSADRCREAIAAFAQAFGFCADCLVEDEECDLCAGGEALQGVDDDTFLGLVVPVLGQLAPETRHALRRHLSRPDRAINAATRSSRQDQPELDARY